MKIEPFPWLRDYLVDMRKLYTELTLEKISYNVLREEVTLLDGYEEILIRNDISEGRIKVLMKGDPGVYRRTIEMPQCAFILKATVQRRL